MAKGMGNAEFLQRAVLFDQLQRVVVGNGAGAVLRNEAEQKVHGP
jgi:hypothetical protein